MDEWFFVYIRGRERAGKEPLLSTGLFKNRTSNLGLTTQNVQWLLLMGTSFTVAVFLQTVRGYNAIETGVIFTAATLGVLASSLGAERFAKRRPQKTLIMGGFVTTLAGIAPPTCPGRGLFTSRRLRARPAADRPRPRPHAHPLGQPRSIQLPGAAAG